MQQQINIIALLGRCSQVITLATHPAVTQGEIEVLKQQIALAAEAFKKQGEALEQASKKGKKKNADKRTVKNSKKK